MSETGPGFAGAQKLLSLVEELLWRPRFHRRAERDEVRGEHALPMVCLVREPGSNEFLTALRDRLARWPPPRVPYAYADAEGAAARARERWGAPERREEPLLPLLDELSARLAADRFGPHAPVRFDYYRLADWLAGQRLSPAPGREDQQVAELLRNWSGRPRRAAGEELTELAEEVPSGSLRLGFRLLTRLGRLLRLTWLEQRIPGLASEARWFMRRQPYMVPRHSTSFLGFAERLTAGRRASENPEQIKKLLVHAFLQDLRHAYRRRRWAAFPHRAGWRRTAYTAVLLDHISEDNGGCELLRLISEVRNETGEHDPLLVVTAGDQRPAAPEAPGEADDERGANGALPGPADAENALARWRDRLPSRRQRLVASARFLEIALPPATGPAPEVWRLPEARRAGGPRRPPWPARRGAGESALALAVLVTLLPLAGNIHSSWSAGCSYFRGGLTGGVSVRAVELAPGDRQCVGYSDSAVQVFGSNARLRAAQRAVFAENKEAARLHRQSPGRPLVAVVHLAGLTHREAVPDTDHASAEELEGLLLRQRELNGTKSETDPLLRVVVSNAGDNMRRAPEVVRDLLVPLFDADPSVLGVMGLDRSVAETEEAIRLLGLAGVPTVGTTLTATGLAELSPLYFQPVPDNARQAVLIAEYAAHRDAAAVVLAHPPLETDDPQTADTYLGTLVAEVRGSLGEAGLEVRDGSWTGQVSELPARCATGSAGEGGRELIYYAGREEDFGAYLRAVTTGCTEGEQPEIVAADAVSRFVAQRDRRVQPSLSGLPMSYVGMGSQVTLAGESCLKGTPSPVVGRSTELNAFCAGYATLHTELTDTLAEQDRPVMPWPAERTGGTYDAAGLLLDAVARLHRRLPESERDRVPHRSAVAQQLRESVFTGATGRIDFRSSRIGNGRALAILRLEDIYALSTVRVCGYLIGDPVGADRPQDPATGCPAEP